MLAVQRRTHLLCLIFKDMDKNSNQLTVAAEVYRNSPLKIHSSWWWLESWVGSRSTYGIYKDFQGYTSNHTCVFHSFLLRLHPLGTTPFHILCICGPEDDSEFKGKPLVSPKLLVSLICSCLCAKNDCCYTSGTKFWDCETVLHACKQSLTSKMSPSIIGTVFDLPKHHCIGHAKSRSIDQLPYFNVILLSHPSSKSHFRLGTWLGQENILHLK